MHYWVEWAYRHAPGWLRGAINWVVGFVTGIVGVVTGALRHNLTAWKSLYGRIWDFRTALHNVIRAVYTVLTWLRNVWVPRLVKAAKDAVVKLLQITVSNVLRILRAADALIDRAWRAATALLRRALDTVARWARDAINAVWRVIPEPIRRAWQLLLNPERLATWAARSIFFALLRLAERNAEMIGRWLLSRGNRFTIVLSQIIVRVIERIL